MADQHHIPKGLLGRAVGRGLLALILAGGLSCGLFETRKPNDPGANTFPCQTLTEESDAFINIEQAYGRGDGLPCYVSSLADSIVFDFDEADSTSAPSTTYLKYTKSVEEAVAQAISSAADSIFVQLKDPYTLVQSGDGYQTRRYAYEIKFEGSGISDTLFQGLAEITVRRNAGGLWQASEWVDRPDPAGTTSRTWGYLRGQFRR